MKLKILCTLITSVSSLALAGSVAITYPLGGETIAPGSTISMTWSNNAITNYGCLEVGIYQEPPPGADPIERLLIAPCFIFPDIQSCTNVQNASGQAGGLITSYPVTIPADLITATYRLHLVIIDTNGFMIANAVSDGPFQVANVASSIGLTRPAHDENLIAGAQVHIKFTTLNVTGPLDIQLVNVLDQSRYYSTGQAEVNPEGMSADTFTIRTDIPPGSYGIRLVGTSASSGEVIYSPSSLTVNLSSSMTTPKPDALVKKGKSYAIALKGTLLQNVDDYSVYFQGNVTTNPIPLNVVSAKKSSLLVSVPVTTDTQGQFLFVGKAWEITGNMFRLK